MALEVADLSREPQPLAAMERRAEAIQRGLDLEHGPVFKAGLFHLPDGDALLLVIHHLAVDTVSWRILLEELELAYAQTAANQAIDLGPRSSSFRRWAQQIREFATGQDLAAEVTHWSRVQTAATTRLPTAQIDAAFLHGDTETIHCALPAEQTAQLLTSVHRAFQTEIMDILLTALGRSLKRWSGGQSTRLTLEGHGREPPDETVDLSRTVGWFTSIYPFVLTVAGEDIGEQVMAVKAALREIPRKGLGYGILRYVQDDGQIGSGPTPQLSFNYLGQFESEGDTGLFRVSDDPSGRTIGPLLPRFHELDMAGMVTGGRMNLSLEFDTRILARETALALMEDFERQLGEVVRYCQSHAAGNAPSSGQPESPAGFPIAGEVEEAYPLSPLQEGLLFQSLFDSAGDSYFCQLRLQFIGALDQEAFRNAWFGLARLYLLQEKFADAEKWAQMIVDSGQGDAIAKKMLEAAKAQHLGEGLRATIEPGSNL